MFLEREKLYVSKTHLLHVVGKRLRHFAIIERAILFLDVSPPRSEVHFIDRERLAPVLAPGATLHPFQIAKLVLRFVNDRRSVGRGFSVLRVRVGLLDRVTTARANLELV